jgi:hypothetical protein
MERYIVGGFSTDWCQEPVLKVPFGWHLHRHRFSTDLSHELVLKGLLKCCLNFSVVPALIVYWL